MIYADTCYEWIVTALACFKLRCILVTLYTNLGSEGVAYGIRHVQPKLIVTSHEMLPKLVETLMECWNQFTVSNIVHFDKALEEMPDMIDDDKNGFNINSLR